MKEIFISAHLFERKNILSLVTPIDSLLNLSFICCIYDTNRFIIESFIYLLYVRHIFMVCYFMLSSLCVILCFVLRDIDVYKITHYY